jgi:hypothetical protein
VGFLEECWWSTVALPTLSSWSEEGKPERLLQRSIPKDDPGPKAISCYGLYLPELDGQRWLRFVDGRPVSSITTRFLSWCCEKLVVAGKRVLLLIWDNAFLARLQGGQALARISQPRSQEQRARSEDSELLFAQAKSVAQCHRAQVDTRQAQGCRTRPIARSLRARRQSLPGIWFSALRASLRSPEGRLIMH